MFSDLNSRIKKKNQALRNEIQELKNKLQKVLFIFCCNLQGILIV